MLEKTHKNHGVELGTTDMKSVGKSTGQVEGPVVADSEQALFESVSALMDSEASPLELRRVLKAASENEEINAVWQRYHLVRASLQQEVHSRPAVNLLAGIHARLEQEQQQVSMPVGRRIGGFFRKAGQVAVAASVAFTVIYSASYIEVALQQENQDSMQVAAQAGDLPELGGNFTPSRLSRTVSMDAAARNRIQQAVYQFSENQQAPLGQPYIFPEEQNPAVDQSPDQE